MNANDADLLKAIAAGDQSSFAVFYDRHARGVYGLLLKMLPAPGDADDILQETFLQVWRQAGRYDAARATPFGWLVVLARSRALDRLRKRSDFPASAAPERSVLLAADDSLVRAETADRIRSALATLPEEQRTAIDLAFFGGLTYEQVARRLEIPSGTAKTRIRLGLQKLHQLLKAAEGLDS